MDSEKDIDFLKKIGELREKYITNYEGLLVLDPEQYEKFLKTEKLFRSFVERNGGEIIEKELKPKKLHGYLEGKVPTFTCSGLTEIADFCKMIAPSSVFGADALVSDNSISFQITIPNIFKQVSN